MFLLFIEASFKAFQKLDSNLFSKNLLDINKIVTS